ncbi:hypothetical protein D307_gp5 [Bacillus phage Bastille]|uniref:Uncharacterized protein n=1 Tax=Bacillus phage Bastille TaxID=57477 RepID=L7UXK2_9CAUD|nr:hypothetical protein D307_gp5 [Bacillus phage Bastille]AGC55699.1 hypothetical protein [Bacillus phage Bastille]
MKEFFRGSLRVTVYGAVFYLYVYVLSLMIVHL